MIAARLKEAQGDMTTEALAREVGISLRLVQKHRAGDNAPTIENLAKYGRVLHRDWRWFLAAEVAA